MGLLLIPQAITWVIVAALIALGVMLHLPTTALIFRTRFLPRAPELDELVLSDGTRVHAGDYLLTVRAVAAENVLSTLPLTLLALYAAAYTGGAGTVVGLVCLLMGAFTLARTAVDTAIGESTVHVGRDRIQQAARPLVQVARLPLPASMRDPLWHQLAVVRFRQGDIEGMDQALARIQDGEAWETELLTAQAAIGQGDLQPARELLAEPADDEAPSEGLETLAALLALHEDRPQDVLAYRSDWERDRDTTPIHRARLRDLTLAAALAPGDPEAARRLLRRSLWRPDQLPWLRQVWPGVGDRLTPLQRW